jgi:polysaccharide deacetylase 2 family uncharacterized protein YibQ
MATDSTTRRVTRRAPLALALSYLMLFALLVVVAAGVSFFGDPHAGDPVVVMTLRKASSPHDATRLPQATPATSRASPDSPPAAPPQKIVRPVYSGNALIADPAFVENTPVGPLPRIADNGMTPMRAYAPPSDSGSRPRIAIVIAGLGISTKQTQAALDALPSGVTLAFAPYGADVQAWVALARRQGHEVLLELPMEPYDFPDSDPGPYTLRAGVGEDANTERLRWVLTRCSGYAGVTNLLGSRFMAEPASLEPVLTYLARRGLMFYDNGEAAHSAAPDIATRVGIAFAQSDAKVDDIQSATEIDRRLSALETEARANGIASGSGRIYPITIERVKTWAKGLSGRGFVLAPASAIVSQPK